jgi:hypothetical protein
VSINNFIFIFSLSIHMKAMFAYGYEIVQTLIVDIERDEQWKKAMNEINAGKLSTLAHMDILSNAQL